MRAGLLGNIVLSVALLSGCASNRLVFTPRGVIRKISPAELAAPVKPNFVQPEVDSNVRPEVTREDLVGKWMFCRDLVDQILDHRELLEEKKEKSTRTVAEFREDGSHFEDGKRFGTWMLKDGELIVDFRPQWNSVRRIKLRRINARELLWTWADADSQIRTFGDQSFGNGFVKLASRGGYDEDGCFRKSVDWSDGRGGRVLFTETVVESPTILRRMDDKPQDRRDPVADERKKNLDSLLKAGVITEDEYKKEIEEVVK